MDFEIEFPLQFYVNLNRRDDRRRRALNGFLNHGLNRVERFPAIDNRIVVNRRGHWSAGRYALALTQKLCLREARRRKAPAVMLFEDDVVLHPEFQDRIASLELPEDWGIFYLGTQHTAAPEWVAPGIVKVTFGLDTHAFAVRDKYYQRVMRVLSPQGKLSKTSIEPSDWLLAYLHKEIPTYAAFPNLAWQAQEGASDLTGEFNGAYDARGFQRFTSASIMPVLRRHLGLSHWQQVVPEETEWIARPNPENSKSIAGSGSEPKIAFLFLTRRIPLQPELWSEYFAGNEDKMSVYIHTKNDSCPGPEWWQEGARVPVSDTDWGHVSLVQAHMRLLESAMRDPANGAFILLSESCVPIKSFCALFSYFERSSWRGMMKTEAYDFVAKANPRKSSRINDVDDIPVFHWRFHSQWIVLNREIANLVLSADITQRWSRCFAPDESLIGTQLSLIGYPLAERGLPADSTWARWPAGESSHPDSFDHVDEQLLNELLAAPHFFARKFSERSNIRDCRLHVEEVPKIPAAEPTAELSSETEKLL